MDAVADSAALAALNAAWLGAYARRDAAAVARVLADDFVGVVVQPNGREVRVTKRELVAALADPAVTYEPVTFEVTHTLVTGTVAVVAGRNTFRGRRAGQPFVVENQYADVYARRRGRWRAVSMHVVRTATR